MTTDSDSESVGYKGVIRALVLPAVLGLKRLQTVQAPREKASKLLQSMGGS
jgi:hypothetical protein